jgi:hypothetical protein
VVTKERGTTVGGVAEKQAKMLLRVGLLSSYPVLVERHSSLRSSQGVISTNSVDSIAGKDIQYAIADQTWTGQHHV